MKIEVRYSSGETDYIQTENTNTLIFDREVDLLLRITGFRIQEEYRDWSFQAYKSGMKHRILVLTLQ